MTCRGTAEASFERGDVSLQIIGREAGWVAPFGTLLLISIRLTDDSLGRDFVAVAGCCYRFGDFSLQLPPGIGLARLRNDAADDDCLRSSWGNSCFLPLSSCLLVVCLPLASCVPFRNATNCLLAYRCRFICVAPFRVLCVVSLVSGALSGMTKSPGAVVGGPWDNAALAFEIRFWFFALPALL